MALSNSILENLPHAREEGRQLSPAKARAEKKWLTAAQRYRDESRPPVLQLVLEAQIERGAYADLCRTSLRELPQLAKPFTAAPSPALTRASQKVHRATVQGLRFCVARQPRRFSAAEARREAAADRLNAVYREWLGVDTGEYFNPRAW